MNSVIKKAQLLCAGFVASLLLVLPMACMPKVVEGVATKATQFKLSKEDTAALVDRMGRLEKSMTRVGGKKFFVSKVVNFEDMQCVWRVDNSSNIKNFSADCARAFQFSGEGSKRALEGFVAPVYHVNLFLDSNSGALLSDYSKDLGITFEGVLSRSVDERDSPLSRQKSFGMLQSALDHCSGKSSVSLPFDNRVE